MIKPLFTYKTDKERVQACHNREEHKVWLHEHIQEITEFHQKIRPFALQYPSGRLLDIVLTGVINDIYHAQAEQEYILRN